MKLKDNSVDKYLKRLFYIIGRSIALQEASNRRLHSYDGIRLWDGRAKIRMIPGRKAHELVGWSFKYRQLHQIRINVDPRKILVEMLNRLRDLYFPYKSS